MELLKTLVDVVGWGRVNLAVLVLSIFVLSVITLSILLIAYIKKEVINR